MTQNNEREAFESWFKTFMPETYSQHVNDEDIEATRQCHSAWLAWQARAQSPISQNEQQEAVAEVKMDGFGLKDIVWNGHHWTHILQVGDKLYTTPPNKASESEINSLKERVEELQADNNQLREALSDTNTRFNEMVDVFYKGATAKDRAVIANNYDLLSATTSSLVEHDNDVIQMCANEFNVDSNEYKTIQALKATP